MRACIVIPCYNEAARLKRSEFTAFLHGTADMDLCFVNDGSKDKTWEIICGWQ